MRDLLRSSEYLSEEWGVFNTVLSLPCDLNPSIHFQEISNDKK